jgi:hypothetical protein
MKLDREKTLKNLEVTLNNIVPESDEDEGAAEYAGEVNSVIMAIKAGKSDEDVIAAAEWVGQDSSLEYVRGGAR